MDSSLTLKLETAVTILIGHGALKDRLALAYTDCLAQLDEQDLPVEVQDEFAQLTQAMHRARALPGDNIVRASIRKLSNEEAQRYAALVVRIYGLRMADQAAIRTPVRAPAARGASPLATLLGLDSATASSGTHGKMASRAQRI
jgi:hypothetical protein